MRYVYKKGEAECALIFQGCSVPISKMVRVNGELIDPNAIPPPEPTPDDITTYKSVPIENLELITRAYNLLKANNVNTVYDLLQYSAKDLSTIPKLGGTTIKSIIESLKAYDLHLSDEDMFYHRPVRTKKRKITKLSDVI